MDLNFWVQNSAQLGAPGGFHHGPLPAGPCCHVGCQLGEPGPVASLDEHPRARKIPTPARTTTARPGSSGHAEGSARRGLPLVTLKRRRLPLMVAGAKLYGNGGRWRGTAPKSMTLSMFQATGKRGKGSGRSAISPRRRSGARRGTGRLDGDAIGDEARRRSCGNSTRATRRGHPRNHGSAET